MLGLMALIGRQSRRDYTVHSRQKKSWFNAILFFLFIISFFPLTLPADPTLLRILAPSVIWIAVLFSILLSVERLLQADYEDGIIEQWLVCGYPLTALVVAKVVVHWGLILIPMVVLSPVLAFLYGLTLYETGVVVASLVCGTPTLMLLCAMAAAFSTTLQQKGVLMGLIVLPLTVPIMILGSATLNAAMDGLMVKGYLACLSALSCVAIAGVPFAIAGALRENG